MARRKRSDQIATVLKLAALREQQAARRLGRSQQGIDQLKAQAQQLQSYQREYGAQFLDQGTQGLSAQALRNYQGFFRNLDQAGVAQSQRIERADQQHQQLLEAWKSAYWRRETMDDLLQQRLAEEERARLKREEQIAADNVRPGPLDPG